MNTQALTLRVLIREVSQNTPRFFLNKGQQGAVTGALNKNLGGDEYRKMVLGWLFASDSALKLAPVSSKTLTDGQWYALWDWIGFYTDETGKWQVSGKFQAEATTVLGEVIRVFTSTPLSKRDGLQKPGELLETSLMLDGEISKLLDDDGSLIDSSVQYNNPMLIETSGNSALHSSILGR